MAGVPEHPGRRDVLLNEVVEARRVRNQRVIVVMSVDEPGCLELLQVIEADRGLALLFGGDQRGQKQSCKDRYDGNHDEEFDQGERGRRAEGRMPNDEGRTNGEASAPQSHRLVSGFDIGASSFLNHSEFVIRHSHNAPITSSV